MAESTLGGDRAAAVLALVTQYLDDLAVRTHDRLGDVLGVAVTMAGEDGQPLTAGASTDDVRQVDETQYELGAGPCLNALSGGGGQYVADLANDRRWGDYGPRAAELGARCCLSVPVALPSGSPSEDRSEVLAVVKVYGRRPHGLSEQQRRLGTDLGPEVAGALGLAAALTVSARETDDRIRAMDHRRTIDLAVGMLSERAQCDPDTAFGLLRSQSQHQNRKLHDVAAEVVGPLAPARTATVAPFRRAGTPV